MSVEILKEQIDNYCKDNKISGILRITVKENVILEQTFGFADINNNTPISEYSMFTFYSLSKPLCAIGLMKLYEKGLVDLNAHPSKYVPEAKGFDERVTIHMLLNHTSGLPDFETTPEFKEKHKTGYYGSLRNHLQIIKDYPISFEPGTEHKYTNINFILCALIIENLSGQAYSDYMKNEVFEPLGMKTAVVDNEIKSIENRVKGYDLLNGEPVEVEKSHNWLFGAGDIVGTVNDVYCLNRAIKNCKLLNKETWDKILTPSPINNMGYGCTITKLNGKKRITHNGGHSGFRTLHVQIPEDDFDIIILSNSGFGNARNDISDMIYNEFYNNNNAEKIEMDKGYAK